MNGILLVDKPQDWTSNDVVCKLRGVLHEKRIGHSGTLDPLATGLLVVFVGRATKAVRFSEAGKKRYLCTMRLGITTDTQDITGNILSSSSEIPGPEDISRSMQSFVGDYLQIPPMYSAIKIKGQKLYDIARRGLEVEREPRPVKIFEINISSIAYDSVTFDVQCSKGTYIRTLCHDIGNQLGCGACMTSLRRIENGVFRVDMSHQMSKIISVAEAEKAESLLLPVESLFSTYPSLTLNSKDEKDFRNGRPISIDGEGQYRILDSNDRFISFGHIADGNLCSEVSFFE